MKTALLECLPEKYTNRTYLRDLELLMQLYLYKYYLRRNALGLENEEAALRMPLFSLQKDVREKTDKEEDKVVRLSIVKAEKDRVAMEIERRELELAGRVSGATNGDCPPLEKLRLLYNLEDFEKKALALIFLVETSSAFRRRFLKSLSEEKREAGRGRYVRVGDLLEIFCENYSESLEARKYFCKTGNLAVYSLLEAGKARSSESSGILDVEVGLSQVIINHILGDNNEYFVSSGSLVELENPGIKLANVVLETKVKEQLLNYLDALKSKPAGGSFKILDSVVEQGRATVFLFYGPSGTGKTMLAKAVSNYLQKPLMSANFTGAGTNRAPFAEETNIIKKILKKAELAGAVLFIDEVDDVLADNSIESRELLIEIEKFTGLVIMATNNEERLDHSFDRRISLKLELKVPDAEQRKKIWEVHFQDRSQLAADVDFAALSKKFIFTGGYIKNCVLTALTTAEKRCGRGALKVAQEDLVEAGKQVKSQMLFPLFYSNPYYPENGLSELKVEGEEYANIKKLSGVIKKLGKEALKPFALFYGKEMEQCSMLGEAVASEIGVPLVVLPYEFFFNDKNEIYTLSKKPLGMDFYMFRSRVIDEIANLNCLVMINDVGGDVGTGTYNVTGYNIFRLHMMRIKAPILFYTPVKEPLSGLKNRANFVFPLNDLSNAKNKKALAPLFNKNIKLEKGLTLEKLIKELEKTGELNSWSLEKVVSEAQMLYCFNKNKPLSLQDLKTIACKKLFTSDNKPLFGRKE